MITRWFGLVLCIIAALAAALLPMLDRLATRHPQHQPQVRAWSNITILTGSAGIALCLGAPAWVTWINGAGAVAIGAHAAWRQRAGLRAWWRNGRR